MTVDARTLAREILAARRDLRRLEPFTTRFDGFDAATGHRIAGELRQLREDAGERVVGRKIGFTNRSIWPEYGVYGPIWGEMYEATVSDVTAGSEVDISHLSQPRIEPEIVLGIGQTLAPGMSIDELEQSVEWVAHGFEIVQTVFPDWKFTAADCVAEGGLHGLLLLGPRMTVGGPDRAGLARYLSGLSLDLSRDGETIDHGVGTNVLDGPVQALKYLVDGLASVPDTQPVVPGEIITTGTITRAYPIAAGQRWSTRLSGYDLPGLDLAFT